MTNLLRRHLRLVMSGLTIAIILIVSMLAPLLSPYNPIEINALNILQPPSSTHLLGTDEFGRDILVRLLYGARPSMTIAVCATLLALTVGTALGVIAGFFRGWTDQIIMRLLDILLTFPPILLAMTIVGFMGQSITNLILVIGVLYIPTFARLAYASTLQLTNLDYISAATALGSGNARIITRHIVPNIMASLIVQTSLTAAAAILLESGLSFLGLGVTPPTPSWGLMVDTARSYMSQAPLYVLWPSLTLAITVLSINTFGDSLRDYLDPRL